MHVIMTIATEPYKPALDIFKTADLALHYCNESGIRFTVRIAASKTCRFAAMRSPEMWRYQKMLHDVVAQFERMGVRAEVVDVTREEWW